MPACPCPVCRAHYDGRSDEFLSLMVAAQSLDTTIYDLCNHMVTRRVRTLGHPIRGVRECANCYLVLEGPCQ